MEKRNAFTFEQGVIRPPNEASSLLVRVTRNCPWNRCHICPAYKGKKFSRRTVQEVKRDIDMMADVYGAGSNTFTSAFLQDADTLILPTEELIEIIAYIRKKFPRIERITTYARAKSMKRKSPEDYRRLKEAGLTRIHSGMESGSLKVLKLIRKGITPDDILEGGRRVVQAGISLSEYIMPGVGGKGLSREHALETAKILNRIKPDFIRVRTFAVHPLSPLQKMIDEGTFEPMNDEEVVAEIRLLLENLDEMPSHFRCGDFSLNLLMQVDGRLDLHKETMLQELDRFLSLTKEQKRAYSLLQRTYPGMRPLEVVQDKELLEKLVKEIERLEAREEDGFNRYIRRLMAYQLPQPQTRDWT
ncbi:MAG: radical SAM protein [Deltaproteobacteria bacterium]|nr:radical SAM protein [Deltaproteobacteria bacterium]